MEVHVVSAYQIQTQMTGKPKALQLRRANGEEEPGVKWANCSLMDFCLDVKAISDINFTCPHHYCEGSFTWNTFQWAEMHPLCPPPYFHPTSTFLVRDRKYGERLCQALLGTCTDSPHLRHSATMQILKASLLLIMLFLKWESEAEKS